MEPENAAISATLAVVLAIIISIAIYDIKQEDNATRRSVDESARLCLMVQTSPLFTALDKAACDRFAKEAAQP